MNYKTQVITQEQFDKLFPLILNGFKDGTRTVRPNERLATILVTQANIGLRISDIIRLCPCNFIHDGTNCHVDIIEQKTGKKPQYDIVNPELWKMLSDYIKKNNIPPQARIFPICTRAVNKQLKLYTDYLGYYHIGTHSFRKFFGAKAFISSGKNIEIVRMLLNHSSSANTQRYIGITDNMLYDVISSIYTPVKTQ